MQQVHILISGKVQGVYYRASCLEVAQKLGLTGWVKNLSTGQVEVLAQGEKEKLEKLIEWCREGPDGAIVNDIKVNWDSQIKEKFKNFIVSY